MKADNSIIKSSVILIFFIISLITLLATSNYAKILKTIPIKKYEYPDLTKFHNELVNKLISHIDREQIKKDLEKLIEDLPSDRYYKSENGYKSSIYLYDYLTKMVKSNPELFNVELFSHSWKQPSVIFRIKGKTYKKVIIGCHIDSINFKFYENAPGVDDNLSGILSVLETINILIDNNDIGNGNNSKNNFLNSLENSLEFHFYAAEEFGSIGSHEVFKSYSIQNQSILAMLQQDMTGYTAKTIETGNQEHFGLIMDYSSENLMNFLKLLIEKYCSIGYKETNCEKICSDHVSALMYGYPAVYALESTVELSNPFIHTEKDTIDLINFDHIVEHVKLIISFSTELGLNTINSAKGSDSIKFRFVDYLILLTMHETKRFIYSTISFACCFGMLYIIYLDFTKKESGYQNIENQETNSNETVVKPDKVSNKKKKNLKSRTD